MSIHTIEVALPVVKQHSTNVEGVWLADAPFSTSVRLATFRLWSLLTQELTGEVSPASQDL